MGKLATSRRRVTRDNVEQEASGCSYGPGGASSGRAFVAVPIDGIVPEERVRVCGPSIVGDPRDRSRDDRTTVNNERAWAIGRVDHGRDRRSLDNPGTRSSVETAAVDGLLDAFHVAGNALPRRDHRPFSGDSRRSRKLACDRRGRGWSIALTAMAIVAVCAPVSGVPMPSRTDPLTGPRHDLDRSTGLEDVYEDAFEDAFREEDQRPTRTVLDDSELEIIRRSIARGLGLKRIPDPSRANVSQAEYERAHREYLKKVQLSFDERSSRSTKKLHVFHATAHPGNGSSRIYETDEGGGQYRHRLFFPVEIPETDDNVSVDHATLRLLLHGHYNERTDVEVLLYLRTFRSTNLIVRKRIEPQHSWDSRWLEFDSTMAVSSWLEAGLDNLGLELEFLHDGEPVLRDFTSPVLNVFTERTSYESSGRTKRSTPEELMSLHKGRRTKCKGESKKCCRHELTVMFKELKGFEFIVYPRTFDAGYCKGRCPPRYNPAHHHALLQSLLWKEDRKKVPKPCCAPSKLDQLMIVYYDENNSTQLKVSYWKNIQVLECACS
ncbi:TGF-beta domain-containing family member maverick [Colletes latitarsis]|uniref:TGF-beta domain-containing family member maverick n=1 Tax=Colletes latitarsis TaxID=2605962 RepID=UPI0040365E0E